MEEAIKSLLKIAGWRSVVLACTAGIASMVLTSPYPSSSPVTKRLQVTKNIEAIAINEPETRRLILYQTDNWNVQRAHLPFLATKEDNFIYWSPSAALAEESPLYPY